MAGANRKMESDLGAHLLRWKARYGSFPKSIEADKAQELWAAGRSWHIAMVPAPPYCYGPHGTIDTATRTARVLVQTALEELNLPKVLYKHVLDGICETWNKTHNKQIGITPAEKHLGFPPVWTFMFGDQVVVKMNEKSLELAGVEVTYLYCDKENSHLATFLHRVPVLSKGIETHTVLEVHPAWLKPVRRGLNKSWLGRQQKWEVLKARHWSDIQAQKQQQAPPVLYGPSLSPVSVFSILSQSRPQEVGGAAAHGPGVAGLEWSEGQPFPSAPETANAAVSPVVSPEAVPMVIPPSASADAAAQPLGVNQEEEEWRRMKEELFGDRALEMKAEEG
uniref:Uncharacterized protein n=1 Tax=Chromera velia CCMP2878 TaxID=1169474 RepID=A0A0G4FJJ4_9ALVE|eukprot:Cvel_17366.t1-p1 / transcript=Cvel_17366.t1 / gene=Cvel_17366 / organism=Chromera_velia_CCMP2878 / gene_product=hypothetical protein / transcript_product=hypothetical protein / location=Cvel_scaffold1380:23857-25095(-) / protein_length=335 / sequence_SO=supercontig / SO=protein_coding / is_pseudo=false